MSAGPAGPDAVLVGLLGRDWDRARVGEWANVLSRLPLFANVGKRQLRRIAGLAEVREFESGDIVVRKGEPADGFHLIIGGRAKVVEPRRAGRLETGNYFGEMALLDGEPRSATVVAVGPLQTMRLPRRPFIRLLQQEPSIAIAMLAELGRRIRHLEKSSAAL